MRNMKYRVNSNLINLLLILISILIAISLFEIFLRLAKIEHPIFQKHDYIVGFSLRPNASGNWYKEGNSFVKINSDGLRDIERNIKKNKNTLRIALLGDSFAEDRSVNLENTFWYLMQKKLNNCKNEEVFGRKSIFAHFERYNFQIVCFCCPPTKMTFLHYIEKKMNVKYRFNKIFNGKIKIKNKYKVIKVKYYVGKKNINYIIKDNNLMKVINKRKFREESFGRFLCYVVRTKYLANIVGKKLSKNQYFLIK